MTQIIVNVEDVSLLAELKRALALVIEHKGEMFGASRKECGNYRELSLDSAKTEAARYLATLNEREQTFAYPQ